MSRSSNASGGEHASSFRCGPDALNYAKSFLDRGLSYQAAARASGVNELTLREMIQRKAAPVVELNVLAPKTAPVVVTIAKRPTPRDFSREIIDDVAALYGYKSEDMSAKARYGKIARPRQHAYFEVFTRCPHLSKPAIARLFCRDHTTVLHGIRQHCELIGISYEQAIAIREKSTVSSSVDFDVTGFHEEPEHLNTAA